MQSSASSEQQRISNNGDSNVQPPKNFSGLKRMQGTTRLAKSNCEPEDSKGTLHHSASMANFYLNVPSQSSTQFLTRPPEQTLLRPRSNLTRTKTSIGPLIYDYSRDESDQRKTMEKVNLNEGKKDNHKLTPLKLEVPKTPGSAVPSVSITPKVADRHELETRIAENEVTPPPILRRTSSGTMLLRQTPVPTRRFNEGYCPSPIKKVRRSGSLPKLAKEEEEKEKRPEETPITPVRKRIRTSSLTSLVPPDGMPVLTPQTRLRPRIASESSTDNFCTSPVKKPTASPLKKRARQDSGSRPPSPLRKTFISTATLRFERGDEPVTLSATPQSIRRHKSTVKLLLSERIAQTYGTERKEPSEIMGQSSSKRVQPRLSMRTTSGDSYYSATEGDEQAASATLPIPIPIPKKEEEVFLTPQNSLQGAEMVPLVKKQISVDEKIIEDEEDEGFGDSTKTIKRGQGAALARSLSLKLSPRKDQPSPIGAVTEKSCSTPSLPTAPLLRQNSASSLRFKVSPSTFLKKFNVSPAPQAAPIAAVMPEAVLPNNASTSSVVEALEVKTEELSEPSTSTTAPKLMTPEKTATMKSALKKKETQFVVREDHLAHAPRRRSVRYAGLKVYYFDRKQGETTVPTEGEVSLDMHNTHHTHRFFPLASGKRPILDLALNEDEELSDGEVIHPDSDEYDYEEYSSAKFIPRIVPKTRAKMLKKSGVKVEKTTDSAGDLRNRRHECGCTCENGVCLPETCQCALDGIECQVDGGDYPTHPCICFAETCTNPNGRIFYDPDVVRDYRTRTIMNWRASQKNGFSGSPSVKKFVGSDDEDEVGKPKSWLLKKAIPIKLEESPAKYPVTPVYTRRSRSSLSDVRESSSETSSMLTTSLADRIKELQHLENEACVEKEKDELEQEDTGSLQEVYVSSNPVAIVGTNEELLETAMSPVKATVVV